MKDNKKFNAFQKQLCVLLPLIFLSPISSFSSVSRSVVSQTDEYVPVRFNDAGYGNTQSQYPDIAVTMDVEAAGSIDINDSTMNAVYFDSTFNVIINLKNLGNSPVLDIQLKLTLPVEATLLDQSLPFASINANCFYWSLDTPPKSDTTIVVSLFGRLDKEGARKILVEASASGDNDLSNNGDVLQVWFLDTLIRKDHKVNLEKSMLFFQPTLEVTPVKASVTDSIWLRVQFPVQISEWNVQVQLPNGEVLNDFADSFIARTNPEPNVWYEIDVPFLHTMLISGGASDEIIFKVVGSDAGGTSGTASQIASIKSSFALAPPNVVSPESDGIPIDFVVPGGHVEMKLYDVAGRFITELIDAPYGAGKHTLQWNGMTEQGQLVGSGVYLITMSTETDNTWKKMIIVR